MAIIELFPTLDAFILVSFAVLLVLHFVFVRRARILVDIVSVYVSFFVAVFGPRVYPALGDWFATNPLARLILFIALVVLFHVIFWRSNIGSFSTRVRPLEIVTAIVYRIAVIGLFVSTALYFSPPSVKDQLGTLTTFLFSSIWALLVWFFIPFLLAFAYKHKTRRGWID